MVLEHEQTNRPMKQNKQSQNRPIYVGIQNLLNAACQTYGEKNICLYFFSDCPNKLLAQDNFTLNSTLL